MNLILEIGFRQQNQRSGPTGILLVTSDLGLCGDFNSRLTRFAGAYLEEHPGSLFYVVGRRGRVAMQKLGIPCERTYIAPASEEGLPLGVLENRRGCCS